MYVQAKATCVILREVVKCHLFMVLWFNVATCTNRSTQASVQTCKSTHAHMHTYVYISMYRQTCTYARVNTFITWKCTHDVRTYVSTCTPSPLAPLHCPYPSCSLATLHCLRPSSSCHMHGSSQQVCVCVVCVRACVCTCVSLSVCVVYSDPPVLNAVKRTGRKLPSALIMEVIVLHYYQHIVTLYS